MICYVVFGRITYFSKDALSFINTYGAHFCGMHPTQNICKFRTQVEVNNFYIRIVTLSTHIVQKWNHQVIPRKRYYRQGMNIPGG